MKTKPLPFIIALVLIANFSFGQEAQQSILATGDGIVLLNTHDFECMPDAVFGTLTSTYNLGIIADAGNTFTKAAESYSATAQFSSMRFWGFKDIKSTEEFLIEFYDGKPGEAGTNIIYAFNATTSPVATGLFLIMFDEIFQFDVNFGVNITQLDGWVSISRTTAPSIGGFNWLANSASGPGGTSLSYNNSLDEWVQGASPNRQAFFCFGPASDDPTAVPITNWVLYLTTLLIGLFLLFRIRKII